MIEAWNADDRCVVKQTGIREVEHAMLNLKRGREPIGMLRRTVRMGGHAISHCHDHLELNVIMKGSGAYIIEGSRYELVPGVILWLLPGQQRQLLPAPNLDMWVATLLGKHCDPELVENVTARPYRRLSGDDAIMLDRLMAHVSQDSDEVQLFNSGLEYVIRSTQHLTMVAGGAHQKRLHPAVLQTIRALRSADNLPSAGKLARDCGISADYLGHLLMEQTGRGFVEWRNRIRLERFQALYPASRDLLTAALDAGFGSYPPFHRAFTEVMGVTPGKWAREGGADLTAVGDWMPEHSRTSDRMVWYPLSAIALPHTQGWLTPEFVRLLFKAEQPLSDHGPVASEIKSSDDLRQHGEGLANALEATNPTAANHLRRVMANADLFGQRIYQSHDEFELSDLATITATYVVLAWMAVNRAPMINMEAGPLLVRRARAAFHGSAAFAILSPVARQQVATAYFAQIIITREALHGIWNGADDATRDRVLDGIGAVAQSITGLDLRLIQLEY